MPKEGDERVHRFAPRQLTRLDMQEAGRRSRFFRSGRGEGGGDSTLDVGEGEPRWSSVRSRRLEIRLFDSSRMAAGWSGVNVSNRGGAIFRREVTRR